MKYEILNEIASQNARLNNLLTGLRDVNGHLDILASSEIVNQDELADIRAKLRAQVREALALGETKPEVRKK